MGRFFTRVALLSFGGAYAVLPYAAQGAVEQFNWLSASQMLDGLALGETTPGPLIMVVAFVGFMGGWNQGLAGAGNWPLALCRHPGDGVVHLPAFIRLHPGRGSTGRSQPRGPALRSTAECHHRRGGGPEHPKPGLFAGPVLWPAGSFNPWALLVVAAALFVQLRLRWSVLQVIGAAALIGVLGGERAAADHKLSPSAAHNNARSVGPGHLSAQPWFCPRGRAPGGRAQLCGRLIVFRSGCFQFQLWSELRALAPGARCLSGRSVGSGQG